MDPSTVKESSGKRRFHWTRIPVACLNLILAVLALWLGMSIPSYFRSVSPLVLQAAAEGTGGPWQLADQQLQAGRPGLADAIMRLPTVAPLKEAVDERILRANEIRSGHPLYAWSGGPAPFYEQFLNQAKFLRSDESSVIPTLLPAEHRRSLSGFLLESPNLNVATLLETRALGGWTRFYPVYSTSGQPLEATILTVALLEQSSAIQMSLQDELIQAAKAPLTADEAPDHLESLYIAFLTMGRHCNWIQLQTLVSACQSGEELLFIAQALQEDPDRVPVFIASALYGIPLKEIVAYLHRHGDRGWASHATALGLGKGAVESLLQFDKPVYHPPAFWNRLPAPVHAGQEKMKAFAESFPRTAISMRVLAFSLCGVFLVGILRVLVLGTRTPGSHERRVLINLDSLVGSVLVTLLVWVIIEPGLLDFRPNEQGSLQIKLAQGVPEDTLSSIETAASTMLDQVTILVLLLFFVAQLLVFILGLLKIAEIRRQSVPSQVKLHLLENEEVLFELGLYVGLGGTVGSLILVVLNVVDASLMAAYASTLFGIIFVAILKVGFLRPFRRHLILLNQQGRGS
jgi:hypothetical protein